MAYRPLSRPDPFDAPRPREVPASLGSPSGLEDGASLSELANALSVHGGGALSADLALDLVLNEIVEHARLATGATAAAIALVRGDEIVCRATTGDNAPDLGVRLDAHAGLSGACVQSQQWQRCDDSEADARVDAEVCRGLGVRSILVYPVLTGETLLGVFEIFSPRPNAFSDREITTLEALSRSIVNNVDRAAEVLAPPAAVPEPMLSSAVETFPVLPEIVTPAEPVLELLETSTILAEPMFGSGDSGARRREYFTGALTVAVIAAALFLGWTLGYVGKQKAPLGAKVHAAAATPTAAPVDHAGAVAPSAAVPTSHVGSGELPPGGLVVYENGRVVYRAQAASNVVSGPSNHALKVPAKVADEYVVQRVEPDYPEAAREQHIQGAVVLVALVSKEGAVENVSTVSGDPQLVGAATDAVQQWRFKPFFRNGAPEEFETQITVSFRLP
jgi:TonB family protein